MQIGLWHSLSSHLVVEILADSGFDWILIDTEHAPNEVPMVLAQLQAMSGGTAHAGRPTGVERSSDHQAPARHRRAVASHSLCRNRGGSETGGQSTRYPPQGFRGFASQARASRYGRIKGYHAAANAEICLLLQVETKRGLENLERIARVEGVDGIFIGPGDLSAALGYLGEPNHPEVVKTIDEAIGESRTAGSVPGILSGDAQLAQHYIEQGCLFAAVGSDIGLLANGAEQLAAKFRSQNPGR